MTARAMPAGTKGVQTAAPPGGPRAVYPQAQSNFMSLKSNWALPPPKL